MTEKVKRWEDIKVLTEVKAKGAVTEGRGSIFLFPLFCFSDNAELLGSKIKQNYLN